MNLVKFNYVADLLKRNGISTNDSPWSVYRFVVEKVLPLYDKSPYRLGDANFMLRKIEVLDSVDRILGPHSYPIIEENILFPLVLMDLYKLESDDEYIFAHRYDVSATIALVEFKKDILEKYEGDISRFVDIISDIPTSQAGIRSGRWHRGEVVSMLLHDIDILAHISDATFLFKAWYHDYRLNNEKRGLLATKTMAYVRLKYLYGKQGVRDLAIDELKHDPFYAERIQIVKELLQSKEKFFQILEA